MRDQWKLIAAETCELLQKVGVAAERADSQADWHEQYRSSLDFCTQLDAVNAAASAVTNARPIGYSIALCYACVFDQVLFYKQFGCANLSSWLERSSLDVDNVAEWYDELGSLCAIVLVPSMDVTPKGRYDILFVFEEGEARLSTYMLQSQSEFETA